MNVLVIHDQAVVGGLETRLLAHAKALRQRGHRVFSGSLPGPMVAPFEQNGVEHIPLRFARRSTVRNAVEEIRVALRAYKIELCDLHPFYGLLPGGLAALAEGVPYTINLHGRHEDFEALALERTLQLLWPGCALAVASSRPLVAYAEQRYLVEAAHLLPVPNTIDVDLFAQAPAPGRPPRNLLLLSRLDLDKLDSVRAALRLIAAFARRANGPLRLRVVGSGTGETAAREEAAKALAGIDVAVEWPGASVHPEQEIASADAVLGMGRVALEGLAARRPVAICGVLGNLAGVCTPDNAERLFQSNFNGRGEPDLGPDEVARQLADASDADAARLADWVRERAGLDALATWAQRMEAAAARAPSGSLASVDLLVALFEDRFRAVAELEALRNERYQSNLRLEAIKVERDQVVAQRDAAAAERERALQQSTQDRLEIGRILEQAECLRAENECLRAENERLRAENEHLRAEGERFRAESERLQAENEHLAQEARQASDAARLAEGDRDAALARLAEANHRALELSQAYDRLTSAARAALAMWPLAPLERARQIIAIRRAHLPELREKIQTICQGLEKAP